MNEGPICSFPSRASEALELERGMYVMPGLFLSEYRKATCRRVIYQMPLFQACHFPNDILILTYVVPGICLNDVNSNANAAKVSTSPDLQSQIFAT